MKTFTQEIENPDNTFFTVLAIADCQFLEEGKRYEAKWLIPEDSSDMRVRVVFVGEDQQVHNCIREYGVHVIRPWSGKSGHHPYDFTA